MRKKSYPKGHNFNTSLGLACIFIRFLSLSLGIFNINHYLCEIKHLIHDKETKGILHEPPK